MQAVAKKLWRSAAARVMHDPSARRVLRTLAQSGRLPRSVWKRLPIVEDPFVVMLDGQCSFRYHPAPGDMIARSLYWRGLRDWEADTMAVFIPLAKQARFFVDVGANTGPYTMVALAANADLSALAYEPVPRIYGRLAANVDVNGFGLRCKPKMLAVSSACGKTQLNVPRSALPSSASLAKDGFRKIAGELVDVEVTTLDADVPSGTPVDLVKIDVEGFEHEVLAGMGRILHESRPVVICECNPDGPYRQVEAILREHRYRFVHLREQGLVVTDAIVPDAEERYRNFACVPAEDHARLSLVTGSAR